MMTAMRPGSFQIEQEIRDFLKQVPLLEALGAQTIARFRADLHPKFYKRKETIFYQGDEGRSIYIVMTGKVRIYKLSPAGGETSINIFFPTDLIGEFAAIDGERRSATAVAIGRCTLLEMSRDRFIDHMRQDPELALALTRLLTRKARWTANYAETVAQYDAAGRLLHTLLLYNAQWGTEIEPGRVYSLDLSLNQTDLASLIGARREWVNRLLREWHNRGLLAYKSGKITILNLPAVEAERDSRIEANVGGW
ncbi:MAG: Crp/Fnr family transcriptional regulator [Anaerolineae bacterium]|nr:Crp/Fnr family transcriptional regulator [Anaerolineae bacterium]